jgi:hypothetical protein
VRRANAPSDIPLMSGIANYSLRRAAWLFGPQHFGFVYYE